MWAKSCRMVTSWVPTPRGGGDLGEVGERGDVGGLDPEFGQECVDVLLH